MSYIFETAKVCLSECDVSNSVIENKVQWLGFKWKLLFDRK